MIYARRGNKLSRISEDETEKFLSLGYDIVDDNGAVLQKTVPTDIESMKAVFAEQSAKISAQEAEIALLTKENAKLKAEISALKSAAKAGTESLKSEQPKKQTRSKAATVSE